MCDSRFPSDEQCSLLSLPRDDLLEILRRCDLLSLVRLSRTCKKLHDIISDESVWWERSKLLNVTNQLSAEVKKRSFANLHPKERIRLSINWEDGKFKEITCLGQKTKYMPWLQLESDQIWLSQGRLIYTLRRLSHSVQTKSSPPLKGLSDDVSRFVFRNGCIISGGREGSLCGWITKSRRVLFKTPQAHASDVTDVAYDGNSLVVSASKDGEIKVWTIDCENGGILSRTSTTAGDRLWTVALEPSAGNLLCCGTAGLNTLRAPIQIYDIEKCQLTVMDTGGSQHRHGAGILHVIWDDPQTVMSCGYDGTVRTWDVRTSKCVQTWYDPHDVALYCIATDNNYAILTGASLHARVLMWDKRHFKPQQMYFMTSRHSSPVYSLAFDPMHLFVALDQSFKMVDFSGYNKKAVDYRDTSFFTSV